VRLFFYIILFFISYTTVNAQNPISYKNIGLLNISTYEYLKTKGFKPRADVAPWPFVLPMDWSADPFLDRTWQLYLHSWVIMDPIILEYIKTNNQAYLAEAIQVALDWYDFHIIKQKHSTMEWYNQSAGVRAQKMAWLYGEIYNKDFPETTRIQLLKLMQIHAERLLDPSYIASGNHAFNQLAGLRLLCIVEPALIGCVDESEYNHKLMHALLEQQFDQYGVHIENSPFYHKYGIDIIKGLNLAAIYPNYTTEILRVLSTAQNIMPWLVYPNQLVARIGDGEGFYRGQLVFDKETHRINGIDVLIGDFIKSGYFTVRTNAQESLASSSQIFITGISNIKAGHHHADELSFELFHKGELVFVDSGKYSYNKNPLRTYIESAQAHNTLSLEGTPIKPTDISSSKSTLISYTVNKENQEIQLHGAVNRPGFFFHQREFRIKPFQQVIIHDQFIALPSIARLPGSTVVFTSNLHINPSINVVQNDMDEVTVGEFATVKLISKECHLKLIHGQEKPYLGWVSFSYNQIDPAFVIQAQCKTKGNGELLWDITLH